MMNSLKPYPAYKDSGVPWLGVAPAHWELRKTKYLFRGRSEKGFPDLSLQTIRNAPIVLPSLFEQSVIVDFLNTNKTTFERMVAYAHRPIALVREYRARLIADVVTGKVDVRDVALPTGEDAEVFDDEAIDADDLDTEENTNADD